MRAYIVSIKYAPGLAKEFTLLGTHLQANGIDVRYILSSGYKWQLGTATQHVDFLTSSQTTVEMLKDSLRFLFSTQTKIKELFLKNPPDFICIYNPHPVNFLLARLARKLSPSGIRAVYLHEPYKPDKSSFDTLGTAYFSIVEFSQMLTFRELNTAILPSPHAYDLFRTHYPGFAGEIHLAPILLPDEKRPPRKTARRFVSLVGTINSGRGLDLFIDLINYAATRNTEFRFRIVTRNDIVSALDRVSDSAQELLSVVNKPNIPDDEITQTLDQSIALFLPHTQVTQSGNVPVSFRSGTPIIARDLPGFSQHIQHKQNGYLLPLQPTVEQLWEAVAYVHTNLEYLSRNARTSYESTFSESNWASYYDWLLKCNSADC